MRLCLSRNRCAEFCVRWKCGAKLHLTMLTYLTYLTYFTHSFYLLERKRILGPNKSGKEKRPGRQDRRQTSDDRRQTIDDRRRSTDDRRQSTDDRRQTTDDSRQTTYDRRQARPGQAFRNPIMLTYLTYLTYFTYLLCLLKRKRILGPNKSGKEKRPGRQDRRQTTDD